MFFEGEADAGVEGEFVGFGVDVPPCRLHDAKELPVDGEGDDALVGSGYLFVEVALVYFGLAAATAVVGDHRASGDGFAYFGVDAFDLLVVNHIGVATGEGFDVYGGSFGEYGLGGFTEGGEHVVDFVEVFGGGFVGGGGDERETETFGKLCP